MQHSVKHKESSQNFGKKCAVRKENTDKNLVLILRDGTFIL